SVVGRRAPPEGVRRPRPRPREQPQKERRPLARRRAVRARVSRHASQSPPVRYLRGAGSWTRTEARNHSGVSRAARRLLGATCLCADRRAPARSPHILEDWFMNKIALAALALALTVPSLASAQETPAEQPPAEQPPAESEKPPSSGVGLLVAGGIFTGLGALNFATAPLCSSLTSLGSSGEQGCLDASLVLGGVFLATGIPLLIVGGVKRHAYNEWKANHTALAGLGFSPRSGGAKLTWKAAF